MYWLSWFLRFFWGVVWFFCIVWCLWVWVCFCRLWRSCLVLWFCCGSVLFLWDWFLYCFFVDKVCLGDCRCGFVDKLCVNWVVCWRIWMFLCICFGWLWCCLVWLVCWFGCVVWVWLVIWWCDLDFDWCFCFGYRICIVVWVF